MAVTSSGGTARDGRARRRILGTLALPDPVRELARRLRERDPELASEAIADAPVGGEGAGPVAERARRAISDRCASSSSPSRAARRLARVIASARSLCASARFASRSSSSRALPGARRAARGPLLVEAREQLAAVELERRLELPGGDVLGERGGVDPDIRRRSPSRRGRGSSRGPWRPARARAGSPRDRFAGSPERSSPERPARTGAPDRSAGDFPDAGPATPAASSRATSHRARSALRSPPAGSSPSTRMRSMRAP